MHLLSKQVRPDSPNVVGPFRPLIGVVGSELEAAEVARANPGLGISWETFRVDGAARGDRPQRVWAVVSSFSDDPGEDPDFHGVFASADDALSSREWRAEGHEVWELEVGTVEPDGKPWTVFRPRDDADGGR